MISLLDDATRDFYRRAMQILDDAKLSYLVGGAYAFARYTGIERHTKDFDIFVKADDAWPVLRAFAKEGYRTEMTFPHWLGKVYHEDAFVDVIFGSGNGVAVVDDAWVEHSVADTVFDHPVRLCPAEEILWSKAFVQERERFDGADVAHLLRARADDIDWDRLIARFGPHWRVLLSHLILFGFIYPADRHRVPGRVLDELLTRFRSEGDDLGEVEKLCQGTLLSRSQYLNDLDRWGYADARLQPRGSMSAEDIEGWTAAISRDGTR